MTVVLSELRPGQRKDNTQTAPTRTTSIPAAPDVALELDVRGLRAVDACERVESVIVGPSVERHRVLDQLHDDEWRIVVVVVALVAEALRARRINPRNVGMLEPRERLGLDGGARLRQGARGERS